MEDRALRAMTGTLENRPVVRPATQEGLENKEIWDRVGESEKKLLFAQKTINGVNNGHNRAGFKKGTEVTF